MAKLLSEFDIPYKVIHDRDQKKMDEQQLQKLKPFHPYNANKRIEEIVPEENLFVVDDTFEDLFEDDGSNSRRSKPFNAWRKIQDLYEQGDASKIPTKLKEVVEFAFNW